MRLRLPGEERISEVGDRASGRQRRQILFDMKLKGPITRQEISSLFNIKIYPVSIPIFVVFIVL